MESFMIKFKYFSPTQVDGENDALAILCSSGTTGLPKGNKIN